MFIFDILTQTNNSNTYDASHPRPNEAAGRQRRPVGSPWRRQGHSGTVIQNALIFGRKDSTVPRVRERLSERSGAREQSEQCAA